MDKRGKDFSFTSKLLLIPVNDFRFAQGLPLVMGRWRMEDQKGVRKSILLG